MGYTTDFDGVFRLNRPLTQAQREYLKAFSDSRRMIRDGAATALLPDPIREAVGLPAGPEGQYYVENNNSTVLDHNEPPTDQPGLWCNWAPTDDGTGIRWNGAEKFYYYIPWLQYLINHFLIPMGLVLNGTVHWKGEDEDDTGRIVVTDNKIQVERN